MTFEFSVDTLVTMWYREQAYVEAETREEAIKKCIEGDYECSENEYIYDSVDDVDEGSYDGPTKEIYDNTDTYGDLIYTNDPDLR